ncbi:hypothetical protein [Rhodopseudomonas sp.]|uniref:hypothetical protein n=1 Tax=Rhodopseudomonas sp. TaxID=1078 RepID=UPI0039E58199
MSRRQGAVKSKDPVLRGAGNTQFARDDILRLPKPPDRLQAIVGTPQSLDGICEDIDSPLPYGIF